MIDFQNDREQRLAHLDSYRRRNELPRVSAGLAKGVMNAAWMSAILWAAGISAVVMLWRLR